MEDLKLTVSAYGLNYNLDDIVWSSSDDEVVQVDSNTGSLSSLSVGSARITATIEIDGNIYNSTYTIQVENFEDGLYTIQNASNQNYLVVNSSEDCALTFMTPVQGTSYSKWFIKLLSDGEYEIVLSDAPFTYYDQAGAWCKRQFYLAIQSENVGERLKIKGKMDNEIINNIWRLIKHYSGNYRIYKKGMVNKDIQLDDSGNVILSSAINNNKDKWIFTKQQTPSFKQYLKLYYDQGFIDKYDNISKILGAEALIRQVCLDKFNLRFDVDYEQYQSTADKCNIKNRGLYNEICPRNSSVYNPMVCECYDVAQGNCTDFDTFTLDFVYNVNTPNGGVLFTGHNLYDDEGNIVSTCNYYSSIYENIFICAQDSEDRIGYALLHEVSHLVGAVDHYHMVNSNGVCSSGERCSLCGSPQKRRSKNCIMNCADMDNPVWCEECSTEILKHLYSEHVNY